MKFETPYPLVDDIAPSCETGESAAELHGILTGMLCVDQRLTSEQWIQSVFGADSGQLQPSHRQLLTDLCEETRRLLIDEHYGFDLFLPDDDAELSDKARCLAEWCQGFLFGLGYGMGGAEWPGECNEILEDIVQISQLDDDVSAENSEEAFTELHEFIRVGVQVILGELRDYARQTRLH